MKKRLNHLARLRIVASMTPSQRVANAWSLSDRNKAAVKQALRDVFPEKNETQIHELFLQRLDRCRKLHY